MGIYLLYACDHLKNKNTMGFIMATNEEADIRNEIIKNISNGCMKYRKGKKDLKSKKLLQLNYSLEYGYIQFEN